ncbi:MAG: 3-deoxy-D-manno-octulosonic acid transferase [Gemmatimonadaceae bacterium]
MAERLARLVPDGGGKIRRSFASRKNVRERFVRWGEQRRDRRRPLIWFHAPSVGEGLQARPVIEALRADRPDVQVAYTWFSPSADSFAAGLDVDFRDVLPFDTRGAARAAIDSLAPTAIVFSKLDVWPFLVEFAAERAVPSALLSATLARRSSRSRGIARLLLHDAYSRLEAVGAISVADAARLIELGCRESAVRITGDTRFDQVIDRADRADRDSALLAPLHSDRPTLVAGSTWPADERELLPALAEVVQSTPRLRIILAPHEPTPAHVAPIERWAADAGLSCAALGSVTSADADVVLVDRVGVLGDLYALADVAFVGGGFHAAGLHSVLEPAAFGAPVIFGRRHDNSREATLLLEARGAYAAGNRNEIAAVLRRWLGDDAARAIAGAAARRVVLENAGATERSVALVEALLPDSARRR